MLAIPAKIPKATNTKKIGLLVSANIPENIKMEESMRIRIPRLKIDHCPD
jgi:hypothetical protein